ncbi:fatty acid desaturase family protein [Streptomyces pristinaespiralis]|uniref:Fatty acid desaturase n=2 Tax=Streptomyces pristinaespiralis TaxID=38300 RepID=B5HIL2_STRE2|nr:acyl-CoA desaturase [Streptomyces pristinaespiralis]ALC18776.1 delta fatty acid desaturase [Streptomyces pristinaespiralis]EDY66673.1 fatty acid desaturase [Streptomyces pristinaespiralis ATCC 25486]QMU18070.1 acyl-CoA desaturase [Streptomyces pristinaespiralis]
MPQGTATLPPPIVAAEAPTGRRSGAGSEFAPLLRTVKEQGLLERRTGWYARGITVNLLALAAVVTGVALLGGSWWVLLLAPLLALFSTRAAFFGHDAGHAQIAADRRTNRIIQLVHANLLLGMSQEWWNDKHNRHHANPNHVDKDPDVAADVLVFSEKHVAGRSGLRGWLTRHQAWLFFPLTTLEGIALKIYGFQAVFSRGGGRQKRGERVLEGALLLAHVAGYAALLLAAMPVGQAVLFALVHQMVLGLHLGMAFAPNHKGMEMPDEETGKDWGHLRRQVLTSRNIRGGHVTDWFLGGLNYQIEHHLFPSMPRPHLRLAQPLVRAHCRSLGIPFTETGLVESYRQALTHLHEVGEPLRQTA